jgi:nicotinamide-nucleotide amidase
MFDLIRSHTETRGIEMTASMEKMAWMPDGSRMLNPEGTACGFSLLQGGVLLYFLPGVPDQMRYLMDKCVIPELLSTYETLPIMRQRILKIFGLNEPSIAEMLKALQGKTGDVILGFYPRFPENHITLSLRGKDEPTVNAELERVEKEIRALLGSYVFGAENESLGSVVGRMLREKGVSLSVAESCTGGLVGHLVTNVPGSSRYFLGGVQVYSNRSKAELLGVKAATLDRHGAVSDETVREMATGVRHLLKADLGLAVSGIAGPDGGTDEKPLGTVHIGLASERDTFCGRYRFWGNREQVKRHSAMMALDWVRRYLHGDPFLSGV